VWFRVLDSAEIEVYVASGEPLDKAGAYAIQGGARGFVDRVEGDLSGVVGLPIDRLVEITAGLGTPIAR
jgi:septum formation protein